MSKVNLLGQYQRALSRWPVDTLRPDISFSSIMQKSVEQRLKDGASTIKTAREEQQIGALFSLVNNQYTKRYPLTKRILEPKSNPDYYKNLVKEIDETSKRSWFRSQLNKWKGFVRFQ